LRVLEEALIAFDGVVVVVSHDRYFLNRVCTAILAFEGEGKVAYSEGSYEYYLEKKRRVAAVPSAPIKEQAVSKAKGPSGVPKTRKLNFKESRELEGMEAAIAEVEEEIARIEALFVDPDFNRKYGQQMEEFNAQLAGEKEKLNALFARWEELEAIRAGSSAPAES
jgi:ATP-binding cassette subfamily F protein uup